MREAGSAVTRQPQRSLVVSEAHAGQQTDSVVGYAAMPVDPHTGEFQGCAAGLSA